MRNADFGMRNYTNAECGFRNAERENVERGAKSEERKVIGAMRVIGAPPVIGLRRQYKHRERSEQISRESANIANEVSKHRF